VTDAGSDNLIVELATLSQPFLRFAPSGFQFIGSPPSFNFNFLPFNFFLSNLKEP